MDGLRGHSSEPQAFTANPVRERGREGCESEHIDDTP